MEHYYSEKQSDEFIPFNIQIRTKKDSFEIRSASGIFSKDKLDNATGLLLESLEGLENKSVLDMGCGYGVVGIYVLRNFKDCEVTFSDVNERALKLVRLNLKKLGLKGSIVKSNIFSNIESKFDVIVSNPPFAAGRKTCYDIIESSKMHLNTYGKLLIVARHNKGGAMLEKRMKEVFGNVNTVIKGSGFRVYNSSLQS